MCKKKNDILPPPRWCHPGTREHDTLPVGGQRRLCGWVRWIGAPDLFVKVLCHPKGHYKERSKGDGVGKEEVTLGTDVRGREEGVGRSVILEEYGGEERHHAREEYRTQRHGGHVKSTG